MPFNPDLPCDFADYLVACGFKQYLSDNKRTYTFINDTKAVAITGNKISFMDWYCCDDDRSTDFSEYASVTGLDQLDLFKFQLLCHSFDLVPLKQFIQKVREHTDELDRFLNKISNPEHVNY
jgi:hypothetical protein